MTASRDPVELLVVANDEFARRLRLVGPGDWRRPTPCSEWDVRALVNHVVGANIRYQLLLYGASAEQVEATRTVDHLGDDALASFVTTADAVVACFHEDGALERIGRHATGDRTGHELLSMRILDAAIHGWDLARAIGADENLDDDVVAFLLAYTADLDLGPQRRSFAPARAVVARDASPQDQLLHRLRSTTIFRRENGEWKIVHRHADPIDDSAELLARWHRNLCRVDGGSLTRRPPQIRT